MSQELLSQTESSMAVLVPLDGATDPTRCGQKAAALAELLGQGFDVPSGFMIPVGAQPSSSEIEAALARLGDRPVAVRSSGVAEDLPDASHAGQYDTVLDVRGPEAVSAAASRVLRSAWSGQNAGYVQRSGPMAVLVQTMVDANVAGVAFSANPLTGDRSEVVVNATRGLADALVAGMSDGDEWSVRNGEAHRTSHSESAIDAQLAVRVATLARRVESRPRWSPGHRVGRSG